MTKHSWVGGVGRSRAVVCLGAALWAGMAVAHPVRYAETPVGHHGSRRVAQTAPQHATAPKAKAGKNSARKTKSRAAAPAPKAAPKPGHHKRHRAVEADNDPPVIYRTKTPVRGVKSKPLQEVAERREPDAAVTPATADSGEDLLAMSAAVSAEDFKRDHPDASATAPAKVADGDMPPAVPQQVVATASATPQPVPTTPVRGRGKVSPFPEDQAGRAALVEEIVQPVVLRPLYTRSGRLIVPPPMKGSRDILIHQNTMADSEGLDRIQDNEDLDRMRAAHLLVPLEDSRSMQVNGGLPENRRYARPWTARFAVDTARAFYARFHQPLHLNSAVRTVEYQLRLQQVNGNAAAVDGDAASPHLTGQALDFGKRGMSIAQIAWMRAYLGPLMQAGKLDVEEEFQQACFHISVYRNYAPLLRPKTKAVSKVEVAQADGPVHGLRMRTLR